MRKHRFSGVPVVNQGKLVGIISIEDFIKALFNGEIDKPIGEKMTSQVVTVYDDEPLVHAIKKFERYGFGRFPVIDRDNGTLVGILTKGDVIQGLLKKLEMLWEEEENRHHLTSYFFKNIFADKTTINFEYYVPGNNFEQAGEAASSLKKTLARLNIHPQILRRIAVATYEAEMNIVIFTSGGKIIANVEPNRVKIEAIDKGPGIPDIERAFEPGFSTAPPWVQELGFGAGMGLPNIKKCADEIKIDSKIGEGTSLEIIFYVTKE
jgi:anti-sigma regulatory factor (Ser/Thr protein kinase)